MTEEEKEAMWYCAEILADNKNDIEHWKIIENLIDKLQKELEEKTTILMAGADKVKQLEKENEELKKDISNMYDKEVVISIICDNFDVTRLEALEMLGEEE